MAYYKTEQELRRGIERELRRPCPPGWWQALVEEDWVKDAMSGGYTAAELAARIRQWEGWARQNVEATSKQEADKVPDLPPDDHIRVLARLVADQAAASAEVQAFRQTYLDGRLLSEREADEWLDERMCHANASGDVPDDLRAFLRLSEALVAATGWHRNVSEFLLSGETPPLRRISWALRPHRYGDADLTRIELQVHPSVSPADVARYYASVQQLLSKGKLRRRRRAPQRPPSVLVDFVRDRPTHSWIDRLEEWNAAHPQWAYSGKSQMQRDFTRAARPKW